MPQLIQPTEELRTSWTEASREWGSAYQEGSGLWDSDDPTTAEGFAAWLERLRLHEQDDAPDRLPSTTWWIVEDGRYVGAITLVHRLSPKLLDGGGHIGYGVRPSARGRGLATWALAEVLDIARERGMDRVLITCDEDNLASAHTIERCGGTLEDIRDTWLGPTRRYWITLRTTA